MIENSLIKENITGVQACVLSTIFVKLYDLKMGLKTGGFISGYRGSPLAGFDKTANQYSQKLKENNIEFVYGLNEDLALTAVAGTQMIDFFGVKKSNISGVVGYWYGKGPGLDRSFDVLHHYNFQGTDKKGGVILFCGDDLSCSSSTMPHHSTTSLKAFHVPVLYPASVEEIFELTLKGVYLSRFSGSYVGLKIITDIADAYQSINKEFIENINVKIPQNIGLGEFGNIKLNESGIDQEYNVFYKREKLIKEFIKKNDINVLYKSQNSNNLGIICSGYNYAKIREFLGKSNNIDILNIRCSWPIIEDEILNFVEDKEKILVIEEKEPLIEEQLKNILYDNNKKIEIFGSNIIRRNLQPTTKEIFEVLQNLGFLNIKNGNTIKNNLISLNLEDFKRVPYFCGGCPHTSSTKLPNNSKGLLGIGCHYLARFTDPSKTITINPMGYEGGIWVSISKFLKNKKHVFVNLGDGTYFHSGILSIRFAVANKIPLTYKILYNGVVGMTGGQNIDGDLTLEKLIDQLIAEGVNKNNIAIVSHYYKEKDWSSIKKRNIQVFPKTENLNIQEKFKNINDVSVIVYDQMCATEKKRKIKRGIIPQDNEIVLINKEICDGCGDCQKKSSCLSIEKEKSLEIEKRYINLDNCGLDKSCIDGFCPSFIKIKKHDDLMIKFTEEKNFKNLLDLYYKEKHISNKHKKYKILLKGIGGTGTSTINKIISDSFKDFGYKIINSLDQTGLSQRYGEVFGKIIVYEEDIIEDFNFETFDLTIFFDYDLFLSNIKNINSKNIVVNVSSFNSISNNKQRPSPSNIKDYFEKDVNLHFVDFSSIMREYNISLKNLNVVVLGYCFENNLIPVDENIIFNNLSKNLGGDIIKYFKFGMIIDNLLKNKEKTDEKEEQNKQFANILYEYDYNCYFKFIELSELIDKIDLNSEYKNKLKYIVFDLLYKKDEFEVSRLWLKFLEENNIKKGKIYISPPVLRKYDKKIGIDIFIAKLLFRFISKFKFTRNTIFNIFKFSKDEKTDLNYRKEMLDKIEKIITKEIFDKNLEKEIEKIFNKINLIRGYGHVRTENILKFK